MLLSLSRVDPRISAELAETYVSVIAPRLASVCAIEPKPIREDPDLIQELREDNKKSFAYIRSSSPLLEGYSLDNGLLLFHSRLCVKRLTPLCTRLIKEAHKQVSSAHPGGVKTYQLVALKYYWVGMGSDCKFYVRNCVAYRLSHPT